MKQEISEMCTALFAEIEDRKKYFERLDQAYKRKKAHDADKKKAAAKMKSTKVESVTVEPTSTKKRKYTKKSN